MIFEVNLWLLLQILLIHIVSSTLLVSEWPILTVADTPENGNLPDLLETSLEQLQDGLQRGMHSD
jgi:hypothetical protein